MISVVIPVYNREKTILRAINSVLEQSFQDFEIIIVDDCSTDNSCALIDAVDDKRVRLIHNEKNSGAAFSRNIGIKNAKGKIISLLDSDDFYEPSFLEESYELLNNTEKSIGFMWTGLRVIIDNKSFENFWVPPKKENNYLTFLHSLHIGTNSGISIKKEVFETCGDFNELLPAAEDTDFFLRIVQKYGYTNLSKVLINIDKSGEDRLSKNYKKIATSYNIFLPQHFYEIDKNKKLQLKFYYKMLWLNYHLSNKKEARKYLKILIKFNILNFKIFFIFLFFELLPIKVATKLHLLTSRSFL